MKVVVRRIQGLVEWLLRSGCPGRYVMTFGFSCLIAAFPTARVLDVPLPWSDDPLHFEKIASGGGPIFITYGLAVLGFALVIVGLAWEIFHYRSQQRQLTRQRVIVIEARGLRDSPGSPLAEAVPADLKGNREQVVLDFRQRVKDGVIIEPDAAVRQLLSLPLDLSRRVGGLDRSDIGYVYAGLAPVPLTFLTGVMLDDEGPITIMDWDRHRGSWRTLNAEDDGKRFLASGIDAVPHRTPEVALAVSVSYRIDLAAVTEKVGGLPLVRLELEEGSPDCHWSDEKQRALGAQFLSTAIALGNLGVKRMHVFLAAQNSVVFRFGRLYDKRNLPEIIVYQYERGSTPAYPWGVLMPVGGLSRPEVVDRYIAIVRSDEQQNAL